MIKRNLFQEESGQMMIVTNKIKKYKISHNRKKGQISLTFNQKRKNLKKKLKQNLDSLKKVKNKINKKLKKKF